MTSANSLLDHRERVIEASSIEQIWSLHLAKMAEYGFSRLLYGFTRFRTTNSFGSADDVLVLSNHPEEYLAAFVQSGLFAQAPMVRWSADHEGACSWRLIAEVAAAGPITPAMQRIFALNNRFDVKAGYSVSFRDVSVRAKGAIGLCARPGMTQHEVDTIWDEHGREITVINNLTHLRITSMPFASSRRALTPRQREALEWVGDGKTTQDIATIMGLTSATVEKHLRLAREALDVDTTAQAVLKAAFQNQIFVLQG